MNRESSGLRQGDEFEYYALKQPHQSALLSESEKQRIKEAGDLELQSRLERDLIGEARFGKIIDRRELMQELKHAIFQRQSPQGVFSEGRFVRPATGFAAALHDAFSSRLAEMFPRYDARVSVNSAVGTVLDLRGVDGFVRIYFLDKAARKPVAKLDLTLDLTTREKPGTAADILVMGGIRTLESPADLKKLAEDIFEAGLPFIIRQKGDHPPTQFVFAPEFDTNEH